MQGVIFCENSGKIDVWNSLSSMKINKRSRWVLVFMKIHENSQSILATVHENSKVRQDKRLDRPKVLRVPADARTGKTFGLLRCLSWQNLHKES